MPHSTAPLFWQPNDGYRFGWSSGRNSGHSLGEIREVIFSCLFGMTQDSAQSSQEPARLRYSRAFRPLSYWLVISAGLLAWDYHRKHAPLTTVRFTVRVEGQTVGNSSAYSATVGKWRVEPGSVAPIGWRNFKVIMPDAEPFEKRLFIWYGENEVGDVERTLS